MSNQYPIYILFMYATFVIQHFRFSTFS